MTTKLLLAAALLCSASAFAGTCPALLDRTFKTVHGQDVNLCEYSDRAILVVNTASRCGFTPQFSKLQAMYDRYKDQGLVVIGFPSNDFRQELASNKEVGEFCLVNYGVKFPMLEKSSVKGPAANALFKDLAQTTGQEPGWNFHKYLIAPGAAAVYSFGTSTQPDANEVMARLKPMLK
jgi:glutathione peroxidase